MPFWLSVTLPNVPLAVPAPNSKATFKPPLVSWLPTASRAVSVTVVVKSNGMIAEGAATDTVDCARLTGPGVTVIVGAVEVTACVLMVAVSGLVPARVPVKKAV